MSDLDPRGALEIINRETGGTDRRKKSDRLLELIDSLQPAPVFFHDERRTGYVQTRDSSPRILPVHSREFKEFAAHLMWEKDHLVPGSEDLSAALNVMNFEALSGQQIRLETRLRWHEDAIWLDMANEKGEAIRITPFGWTIEQDPPILFRRFSHQQPIVAPVRGGDPWLLKKYWKVPEPDHLLVMTYVADLLIPGHPHPVWNVSGSTGASKSTLQRIVKRMIDPSSMKLLALPRDERELVQILDHHYLPFFDNVSSINDMISNALCRAATGSGFSKRQLYTDDSDFTYDFTRAVGLNGINVVARAADLLDRSLLTDLPGIPIADRREETKILQGFQEDLPQILGGFLDVVVIALKLPEPKLTGFFRMADFVSWGYRLAEALGRDAGNRFLEDYTRNVNSIALEAVNADVIGDLLIRTVENEWEGLTRELLERLFNDASNKNISTRQKAWPKSVDAFGRRLRILKEPLGRLGWKLEFGHSNQGSTVRILKTRVTSISSITSNTLATHEGDTSDTSDANSQTPNGTAKDSSPQIVKCEYCKQAMTRREYQRHRCPVGASH